AGDIVEVAHRLRQLETVSIPVNFLIPIPGTTLRSFTKLTPDYCLRVLSMFRLVNPGSELRAAAGRELNLRQMQVMALYPANSLFMEGYLNTVGNSAVETLRMIKEAGFTICSDHPIDDILAQMDDAPALTPTDSVVLKQLRELRPSAASPCA
ncbi:biotin synthase BioB, partial [bacterium]|nr:biotin synthase BioB [bacterium]